MDLVNLLVVVPASALAFYVLLEHLLPDVSCSARRALRVAFVAALKLFAISYGMHEPADHLHARFCAGSDDGPLCDVVAYQDDQLSHALYFAGLLEIDTVLLVAQAKAATLGVSLTERPRAGAPQRVESWRWRSPPVGASRRSGSTCSSCPLSPR